MALRTLVVVSVASVLLISGFATPIAASSSSDATSVDEPALVVDLEEDGDATVTLVSVYDLDDDDEQDAFESIRTDESTQAELLDRFDDRLEGVTTQVAADADREISVATDAIDVRIEGDRGIVALSVTWTGLAAVEDGQLVVDEPFASGYEPDRTLVVTVPEDATIESVTPEPTAQDGTQASWDAGTDLEDFELVAQTDDDSEAVTDDVTDSVPGFGSVVALVALVATVLIRRER